MFEKPRPETANPACVLRTPAGRHQPRTNNHELRTSQHVNHPRSNRSLTYPVVRLNLVPKGSVGLDLLQPCESVGFVVGLIRPVDVFDRSAVVYVEHCDIYLLTAFRSPVSRKILRGKGG